MINQSYKEKFTEAFSKWLEHQKFHLYSLKISANVKIPMQSFEFCFGVKCSNPPP